MSKKVTVTTGGGAHHKVTYQGITQFINVGDPKVSLADLRQEMTDAIKEIDTLLGETAMGTGRMTKEEFIRHLSFIVRKGYDTPAGLKAMDMLVSNGWLL